jgi:transposase
LICGIFSEKGGDMPQKNITKTSLLEQRRFEAIRLIAKEHLSPTDTAKRLGVTLRAVQYWNRSFLKDGKNSLKSKPKSGRPSKLTVSRKNQLVKILLAGACKTGFPTDLWSCPRVAHVINKKWGISYHVDHVIRLLYSLGFTPQKPERRALERDDKRIKNWVRSTWPRIKKKPSP